MRQSKWVKITLAVLFTFILFLHFDGYEVFIFQDSTLPDDYTFQLNQPFEEITMKANDGASIHSILLKTRQAANGIILYFHGNRGNLSRWAQECNYLAQMGYQVLIIDYRGYGKSKGKRNESNFYADAFMAYQQCQKLFPPEKIIVLGRSLGSGPASWLAANAKIRALVLETPYTRLSSLIEEKTGGFPMHWFLDYQFDNLSHLKNVDVPVMIIHGTQDDLIPMSHAVQLSKICRNPKSALLIIQNGGHNNLASFKEYQNGIKLFLSPEENKLSQ